MGRLLRHLLLPILACLLAGPVTANINREIHRFYGYAFDQKSGRYLYTEVHRHVYEDDTWVGGTIRYFGADGQLLGEKTLDFTHDPYVPVFRLSLPGEGYAEGISAVATDSIEVDKQKDGRREHARIERVPSMVADSGFHSFVVQHLEELRQDKTVIMDFIAVGRLHDYRFRLQRVSESQVDGHTLLHIRAEPDSLLRYMVPPLLMEYDLQTHYLVEYRGLSNLHDPATGKALLVRLVYPSHPPTGAPANLPPLDAADSP